MKRILIITPFFRPNVGGAETYADGLCEFLRNNDFYIYVITYQPITTEARGLPFEKKENLEIRRFQWIGFNLFHRFRNFPVLNFFYLTPCLFMHSFLFLLRNPGRIDTIDAQGLNAAFIARVLKPIFSKRAVMSTMALYNFKKGSLFSKICRWVLSGLDTVLAESQESKNEIAAIGVPEDKIKVFSHWVDQEVFRPRDKKEARRQSGLPDKFIVLFVGRAIPIKGATLLVEVATMTKADLACAFISAAGPEVEMLRGAAAENPEKVKYIGEVPYKELYKYYNAADVLAVPSQYEEGVARVVLEAVSSGTPVVGSNRGALPSVLPPSVAILVKPETAELKKAIEFLYNNPGERERLARNCRAYALEKFSSKNARVIADSY